MQTALDQFSSFPDEKIIKRPTVAALLSCSPASVTRWAKQGLIPQPQHIGKRAVGWRVGSLRKALSGTD
jgi:predicted DNA-binding transcriptional regulator AlpA